MLGIPSLSGYLLPAVGGVALAASAFGAVQTWRMHSAHVALDNERDAHKNDIAFWKQTGIIAITRARASKARIEAEQWVVTQRIENETQSDIAAVRAKYERLRLASQGDSGSSRKPDLPFNVASLPVSTGATFHDRLLAYRERVRRSAEECEVTAKRFNKFIDAYEAQSQIDRSN